ncbi:MAG: DNA primase [Actinomycetota bacterium]|nr:DNA primase [Actinomycetota bacterium]
MPRYPDEAREQIRDAVDFADLVGARTELRRAGSGRLEGLCPFHDERTPSFGIDPGQKLYHCFGCGAGGDVFKFVQETDGLDFVGAMEYLADRYGVTLEPVAEDPGAVERRKHVERLHELLDRTAGFYERYLWDSAEAGPAREYLAERGLKEAALRAYRVGYSPSRFDVVLKASRQAGFSNRECDAAGLTQRSQSGPLIDRFRRRIMFPLADRRGRIMGFGARALGADQKPKYLNSSENELFSKGRNVYGAHVARVAATKAGSVVLCEGYTDVIALHQAGLANVVGSMGTALTEQQVGELARLAPQVALALDADAAGQEAMLRVAKVAAGRRLELRVVLLPAGRDPADVVADGGPDAIGSLVEASVPFVTFRVQRELAREDLASAEAKDRVIDALRPVFAALAPSALREELIRSVADATGLKPTLVVGRFEGPRRTPPPAVAAGGSRPTGFGVGQPRGGPRRWTPPGPPQPSNEPHPAAPARRTNATDPLDLQERQFLAACVGTPKDGATFLADAEAEQELSTPLNRRAITHLRAHLDAPASATDDDPELAAFMAELVNRATHLRSRAILEAEALKLRKARLDRRISDIRAAGSGDIATLAAERQALLPALNRLIEQAEEAELG